MAKIFARFHPAAASARPAYRTWLNGARNLAYGLWRDIGAGGLDYRAMSLVYTTLLSLAPILAVSFSVLKAFGVHNQMEPLLLELMAPLGEQGPEIVGRIIGFVNNMNVGVLGFVGFATLFYTVLALLQKIEDSFNYVWRVSKARSFRRRFSDYLSVILVGPVLVFSAVGLIASMASNRFVQAILALEPFGTLYYVIGQILPTLLIIAAVTFIYAFIPNTQVKLKAALLGGLFAGLGWRAVGWVFGEFVATSTQYAAIYSSFAILILFMIWLYQSWLILLLGAQVAFYAQHPRYLRLEQRDFKLSYRLLERLGLSIMALLAENFLQGKPPWTATALTERLNLPHQVVERILETLRSRGLILLSDPDAKAYLPARDLSVISLTAILEALQTTPEEKLPLGRDAPSNPAVERLIEHLDRCRNQAAEGVSLRDMVEKSRDSAKNDGPDFRRAAEREKPA
jgi:membrane protein